MESAAPKRVAREAEQSTPLRVLARSGYAANGVVHIVLGIIVVVIAFGGTGDSNQSGAFRAIAAAPLGFVALWALAITLLALGLWHGLEGVLARKPERGVAGEAKKWGARASEWGQAMIFFALGLLAAFVALGARPNTAQTVKWASRAVLSMPGGAFVLAFVGLAIGAGGIAFAVMGLRRSFEKKMSIPSTALGMGIKALGVGGFIAKGVALVIVGVLLMVAAATLEAETVAGLDGAIQALARLPFGPWLVGAVGVGLLAYGLFCLFRAPLARL